MTDVREPAATLVDAIEAFNESSDPKIELLTTRDARKTAKLPRVGREIIVFPSMSNASVRPRAEDIAWLCEEARRAAAPKLAKAAASLALIEAALGLLEKLDEPKAEAGDGGN